MKISDHITYAEAIHSQTAKRKGIDNTPNPNQIEGMDRFDAPPAVTHIGAEGFPNGRMSVDLTNPSMATCGASVLGPFIVFFSTLIFSGMLSKTKTSLVGVENDLLFLKLISLLFNLSSMAIFILFLASV